ncbi:hypothetical protein OIU76_022285 [Salix suchowensis]|nr:hypothetical protein OIU76_022285 [Salix suchowensis]
MCICKICGSPVVNGEKIKICDHSECPGKYFHVRCLTMRQMDSRGPRCDYAGYGGHMKNLKKNGEGVKKESENLKKLYEEGGEESDKGRGMDMLITAALNCEVGCQSNEELKSM